jgi:transposase
VQYCQSNRLVTLEKVLSPCKTLQVTALSGFLGGWKDHFAEPRPEQPARTESGGDRQRHERGDHRRRFGSEDEKPKIVLESLEAPRQVAEICRFALIAPPMAIVVSLRAEGRRRSTGFVPAMVVPEAMPGPVRPAGGGAIEIEFAAGARMRITGGVGAGCPSTVMIPVPSRRILKLDRLRLRRPMVPATSSFSQQRPEPPGISYASPNASAKTSLRGD